MVKGKIKWDKAFTKKEWSIHQEHEFNCQCPLCKRIRKAIHDEVRRPLHRNRKKESEKRPPMEFEDIKTFHSHKAKCKCEACMKAKNFYGIDKELEEILLKYEEE